MTSPQSASLIIDARHRLSRRRRLAGELATAGMWASWLSLWRPLVTRLGLPGTGLCKLPFASKLLLVSSPMLCGGGSWLLFGLVALLLGALGHARRTEAGTDEPAATPTLSDYAAHFQLAETQLFRAQHSRICTVHHDDAGRIVALEPATAVSAAEAIVPLPLPVED